MKNLLASLFLPLLAATTFACDSGDDDVLECASVPGFADLAGIYDIEVHPADPNNVLVRIYPGGNYVSVDGGETASEVESSGRPDPRVALRWYDGDLVSEDGGLTFGSSLGHTWLAADLRDATSYFARVDTPLAHVDGDEIVELDPTFDVERLVTTTWCEACLFATTKDGSGNVEALEVSTDGGASFTMPFRGADGAEFMQVAREQPIVWLHSPSVAYEWDGSTLVEVARTEDIDVASVHPTERLGALGFRRNDEASRPLETLDGVTWTELDEGLPAVTALAYAPDGESLWLGTEADVLRCEL